MTHSFRHLHPPLMSFAWPCSLTYPPHYFRLSCCFIFLLFLDSNEPLYLIFNPISAYFLQQFTLITHSCYPSPCTHSFTIYPGTHSHIHPSTYTSIPHLLIHPAIHPSIHLSIRPPTYVSNHSNNMYYDKHSPRYTMSRMSVGCDR